MNVNSASKPCQAPQPAESVLFEYFAKGATVQQATFYRALQPHVHEELRQRLHDLGRLRVGQHLVLRIGGYEIEADLTVVRPPLAQLLGRGTHIEAIYVERTATETRLQSFLAGGIEYPNPEYGAWFDSLVGIDHIKSDLLQKMQVFLSRDQVLEWSRARFGKVIPACAALLNRYPFFVLEGEVGSGKTALARSIGHPLSVALQRPVELLVVNTQVRGTGLVGELTRNISLAFDEAETRSQSRSTPILLLLDEADTLAQARGHRQMHHEDEAGVNTLIQRIDLLREPGKQVMVLFATNIGRLLDTAIQRRAAGVYHFDRPDDLVRRRLFETFLAGTGVSALQIEQLVEESCPKSIPGLGPFQHPYTHSDIVQRIIPTAMEWVYLSKEKTNLIEALSQACRATLPTPLQSLEDVRDKHLG